MWQIFACTLCVFVNVSCFQTYYTNRIMSKKCPEFTPPLFPPVLALSGFSNSCVALNLK